MNASDLKPASALAMRLGVKCLAYGPPGIGKTPLINTAPRPVLLAVEPGLLSMRNSNVPTYEAYDAPRIDEFFTWLFTSAEARNYDTVGVDSISQMAEIILTQELKRNKDGRKAYGEMSRRMMEYVGGLYFLPGKHMYLIAKRTMVDDNGVQTYRPYFPGQDLNVKIPHLYDLIVHIAPELIGGVMQPAIRTKSSYNALARDRSGKLAELEPLNLANLFNKCM